MDAAEREDFDTFVRSRMPQLLGFANALTRDPHRAADLVQDALERTALAWSRVVRRDHPEAYVRRVMVNQHISVWRRLRREHLVADAPETAYEQSATHYAALWREIDQ